MSFSFSTAFRTAKQKRFSSSIHHMKPHKTHIWGLNYSKHDHIKAVHMEECLESLLSRPNSITCKHKQTHRVTLIISLLWERALFVTRWILLWGCLSSASADQSLWCEKWFWSAAVVIDNCHPPRQRCCTSKKQSQSTDFDPNKGRNL